MAELYTNADQTTVAAGGYTPGSGVLNVANSDGDNGGFPTTAGTWRVTIYNHTTGEARVTLRVNGINSPTQLDVDAEGPDLAAFENNIVRNVLTAGAVDQIKTDIIAEAGGVTEGDLDDAIDEANPIGAYASLPAASSVRAGTFYRQTDGPYILRSNGSAWTHLIPEFGQVTPPSASGWSWVNQGGASVVTTHGGLQLLAPAGAGDNHRIYVRSPGNSTFTATLLFTPEVFTENSVFCGLYFREAGTGKLSAIGVTNSGGSYGVRANRWASPTTSGVAISSLIFPAVRFQRFILVQMQLTSTDVIYRVAYDNRTQYYQVATESKTTSFTTAPDQYGIGVNSNNATYLAGMTAWSIVEA